MSSSPEYGKLLQHFLEDWISAMLELEKGERGRTSSCVQYQSRAIEASKYMWKKINIAQRVKLVPECNQWPICHVILGTCQSPPPSLGWSFTYVRNRQDSLSSINPQVMFTSRFLFPSVLHHYLLPHWYLTQVLAGDLEEAICTHALHYSIWRRYEAMPERFDWHQKAPNVRFYPLRPELVESTYLLYQVCAWSYSHSFFFRMYVPADMWKNLTS